MSTKAVQHNDTEMLHEEVEGEPSGAAGTKRTSSQSSGADIPPPKARKIITPRSPMWKHFVRKATDHSRAICTYCGVEISCDTISVGTSPMKNHIKRCKLFLAAEESGTQKVLAADSNGVVTAMKYDRDLFRRSVNEMIVLNELPFSFVESEGFRRFCLNVLPMYHVHCRKTATTDIFAMFVAQKDALKRLFSVDKQRVSLTTDIWTAPTTSYSYMVVTAHWISANWEMQKRIISFKPVTDHTGETIANHLFHCLHEWGIEKVFTVTVDNAKGNDKALRLFTEAMKMKGANALVRGGAYLHMRCCAHVLNLIVRDGLAHVKESVVAIRNAVKYVRSSFPRLRSFLLRVEIGDVSRGSLALDCKTRWNSTYLMLCAALKLRAPFQKMMDEDKLYNAYFLENEPEKDGEKRVGPPKKRVGPPTAASWDEVHRLVKFLRIFFNCTLAFSASTSVTSSICYNEIVTIERSLISLSNHRDGEIRREATSMRAKFDKYWDGSLNMNPLVIIASVFDPRNKMGFASLCFDKLYGKDSLQGNQLRLLIRNAMKELYEEYVLMLKPSDGARTTSCEVVNPRVVFDLSDDEDDGYERMDSLYTELSKENANEEASSELDMYLLEKAVPRTENDLGMNYDVLSWWKKNSPKYPILSEMARDVLAMQASSVASESAFSTSGRILDPFRSCLTPYMIEALVCSQQWLRNTIQAEKLANLNEMFEELNFHDSLDARTHPPAAN